MGLVREPEILEKFIKLRLQGLSQEQIKGQLSEFDLTDNQYVRYHHQAGVRIRDIQENEVLNTRVLHASRYELLYEWFIEKDFDNFAMKMLENIERLCGLHSNSIGLSIHNLVENKPQKVNLYKKENLTDSEYNRLQILMKKAER